MMRRGNVNGRRKNKDTTSSGQPHRFAPVAKSQKKSELILAQLRQAIEDGTLPIGSYHSIAELGREFGASRTPVHDAGRSLMHFGLVELVDRKGILIVGTTGHDVEDIFQIRLWLEPPAADLATRRLMEQPDPTKLEELKRHFEEMLVAGAKGSADDFWVADADFHGVIHEATGNARLPRYLRDLRDLTQLRPVVTAALVVDGILPIAEAHRSIYKAIATGQPEQAHEAMAEHIIETARVVREAQQRPRAVKSRRSTRGQMDPTAGPVPAETPVLAETPVPAETPVRRDAAVWVPSD